MPEKVNLSPDAAKELFKASYTLLRVIIGDPKLGNNGWVQLDAAQKNAREAHAALRKFCKEIGFNG